jgi:hypothetical protein
MLVFGSPYNEGNQRLNLPRQALDKRSYTKRGSSKTAGAAGC